MAIDKLNSIVLISIISLISLVGCSNNSIENPDYAVAYVDSTRHVHLYKGYYKLKVFYTLSVHNKLVHGVDEHKMEKAYTAKYETGDSVLVRYDRNNIENSEIVKITFKKRKIKL